MKADGKLARIAPALALCALSFLFRLPPLVNAAATNSDAAIVGIQAMHIERGERSFFLLGSTYQTSVDSFWAVPFFEILGPTPRALMLSALVGHVLVTLFTYAILARMLTRGRAFVLSLLLVFTPAAVHSFALYPPREMSLTIAFLAFFCMDRAMAGKAWLLAPGAALAAFACFADPYAFVLMPAAAVVTLSAIGGGAKTSARVGRFALALVGAIAGAVPLALLFMHTRSKQGELGIDTHRIVHNTHILVDAALPWLLGTKPYVAAHMMDYAPWTPPPHLVPLLRVGAISFVVAVLAGPAVALARDVDRSLRAWALAANLTTLVTLLGFSTSVMVMDHFSMRYLTAILLVAPFSIAPLATLVDAKKLALGLAPYLVTAAIGGWVSYGPDVHGLRIVREPGASTDDYRLGAELRARGVHFGVADYWVSYRLTFLFREDPIVVPSHESQDRYAPYRAAYARAETVAYIVDPLRSEESVDTVIARFRAENKPFERLDVGRMTALVFRP